MRDIVNTYWIENFSDTTPLVYQLKHKYKERWVRFHSLPQSKRYPENEVDYTELLHRYNQILKELFGVNSRLFIIIPEYSESKTPTKPAKKLRQLFRDSHYWRSIDMHEEYDQEFYWHLHVASLSYSGYELNALLRLIAIDEVRNCFVISEEYTSLFHPYDGGSDCILQSTERRDDLKERFGDWLSNHPKGF